MLGIQKEIFKIFKNTGSTYFYVSLIFPSNKRKDIFNLYAFLRTVDDLIDQKIPAEVKYQEMKKEYHTGKSKNKIVQNFIELEQKYNFKKEWVNDFFKSMETDLKQNKFETLKELEEYIHGVAEVVGFFICRIMGVKSEADQYAALLGKTLHYMNLIRDIGEDKKVLNREYVPLQHLEMFGLESLDETEVMKHREEFVKLIRYEIASYKKIRKDAIKVFKYFPKRLLIPIKTSVDISEWVIKQIEIDPFQVYLKKIKPHKLLIFKMLIKNLWKL